MRGTEFQKHPIIAARLLFFMLFLVNMSTISAYQNTNQTLIEYKGKIIDSEKRKPLIFADISVPTTNISTISNKEGKFSIKIPERLGISTLSISFLGYETTVVNLSQLEQKINIIVLHPTVTELAQISINAPKDARALVKLALKNRGEKYIKTEATMTAFYRETIKKRKKNASLTEAVVKIYKQPYHTSRRDEIELVKSRKNTNYSRLDTIALKLQGGPFSALFSDIVKYPDYIFTKESFDFYDFSFNTSTEINDRNVYVVNFKQQENSMIPLYKGNLYIDAETFAIISADYELNIENKAEATKLFLKKKPRNVDVETVTAQYKVDYKLSNNKWHYSYSNLQLAFRVKWAKKLFSKTYTLDVEMAVTDWDNNLFEKINSERKIKPSIILSDEASGFSDLKFWGKFNIIEPEKSIESAIRKISKQLTKIDKND